MLPSQRIVCRGAAAALRCRAPLSQGSRASPSFRDLNLSRTPPRAFTTTTQRLKDNPDAAKSGENHEGSYARTDPSVQVEYPEEADLPSGDHVQGRGGLHFKRTLASFSLEGRVATITGGARGIGLVLCQALIISGADVAIVDLNRTPPPPATIEGPSSTIRASLADHGHLQ